MSNAFFFENRDPGLYGEILGSNQAMDFSGSPYFLLPPGTISSTSVVSKSVSYALTSTDNVVLVTTGSSSLTMTLPTTVGAIGKMYMIKKVDSGLGTVTIATTSSQKIDGEFTQVIPFQWASLTLLSDGANWYLV